jgi:hypothetical protein
MNTETYMRLRRYINMTRHGVAGQGEAWHGEAWQEAVSVPGRNSPASHTGGR